MATQFRPTGEFAKFIAEESLSVGDVICLGSSDNGVVKADASDLLRMPAIGFVKSIRGSNCIVQLSYIISLGSLIRGAEYFVSTSGGITKDPELSADGYMVQRMGKAINSNQLLINVESQIIFL